MAKIQIEQAHGLTKSEARARIARIAQDLKNKLDVDYTWEEDALCFQRPGASGSIRVEDHLVECTVELGMLLAPMKGPIEESLLETLREALAGPDSR